MISRPTLLEHIMLEVNTNWWLRYEVYTTVGELNSPQKLISKSIVMVSLRLGFDGMAA